MNVLERNLLEDEVASDLTQAHLLFRHVRSQDLSSFLGPKN
jgi:hypothetical protein